MGGGLWQQLASAELTRDECVLSRLPSLVLATAGQRHTIDQYCTAETIAARSNAATPPQKLLKINVMNNDEPINNDTQ